ncbi:hypothetical protein [Helicobacter pylori]|uniref:hypothetical protein n=1 Tax=Helicobacter pylori TaxID=210 RepID=UPI001E391618|nr:hypothetical protein [Helicobacter pylori]
MDRLKKRSIDTYKAVRIKTGPNYDLNQDQQEILIYLHHRKAAYDVGELANKVAMDFNAPITDFCFFKKYH